MSIRRTRVSAESARSDHLHPGDDLLLPQRWQRHRRLRRHFRHRRRPHRCQRRLRVRRAVTAGGDTVEIGVKNYGGSQLATVISATAWTQASITFTTGATTTQATVFCYHNAGSSSADCDDVRVQAS
jgi:hypothetical protein